MLLGPFVRAQNSPPVAGAPAQAPAQPKPQFIDNDTLIRMAKAGLGDDILVQTIQLQPGHYDTSPDALIALRQAGLSDRVIGGRPEPLRRAAE